MGLLLCSLGVKGRLPDFTLDAVNLALVFALEPKGRSTHGSGLLVSWFGLTDRGFGFGFNTKCLDVQRRAARGFKRGWTFWSLGV